MMERFRLAFFNPWLSFLMLLLVEILPSLVASWPRGEMAGARPNFNEAAQAAQTAEQQVLQAVLAPSPEATAKETTTEQRRGSGLRQLFVSSVFVNGFDGYRIYNVPAMVKHN